MSETLVISTIQVLDFPLSKILFLSEGQAAIELVFGAFSI